MVRIVRLVRAELGLGEFGKQLFALRLSNRVALRCAQKAYLLLLSGVLIFLVGVQTVQAESFRQKISLKQELQLSSLPGTLSLLRVEIRSHDVEHVRALLYLDDSLLSIGLKRGSDGIFEGRFPTPRHSLSYQLQFLKTEGRAELSPLFMASNGCRTPENEAGMSTRKSDALREARALNGEIRRAQNAGDFLAKLEEENDASR